VKEEGRTPRAEKFLTEIAAAMFIEHADDCDICLPSLRLVYAAAQLLDDDADMHVEFCPEGVQLIDAMHRGEP
jgi:hypothetical protein